jgi:hypothetical protein
MSLKQRKIISLGKPLRKDYAVLEYRIVWNDVSWEWGILRNGTSTGLARRKKQSALDIAILAIQNDENASQMKAKIVSLKDGLSKIEWTSSVAGLAVSKAKSV